MTSLESRKFRLGAILTVSVIALLLASWTGCTSSATLDLTPTPTRTPKPTPTPTLTPWPTPQYDDMVWDIQCVDCPKRFSNMSDRSLALDAVGYPHVAYGEGHLYYAWYDGATWHTETVDDAPGVGQRASLALDGQSYAHIAYYDASNKSLKYAHQTEQGWDIQTVGSVGKTEKWNDAAAIALALDSAGRPHIGYKDFVSSNIEYARWIEDRWDIQTVARSTANSVALVLDATDQPHVGYIADGLKYARWMGQMWDTQIVDDAESIGAYLSMALDGMGSPRILYYTDDYDAIPPTRSIKYAEWSGSVWNIRMVGAPRSASPGVGDYVYPCYISLALDASGNPHVSLGKAGLGATSLEYATWTGTSWFTQTVDCSGSGWYTSIALDTHDHPCISYRDKVERFEAMPSYGGLKVTCWSGEVWNIQIVDSAGGISSPDLALDTKGRPHISYAGYYDLKYARWTGDAWDIQAVSGEQMEIWRTSLALDAADRPHITYDFGRYGENLQYVHWTGDIWITQTVDSTHSWGSSLALDAFTRPHVTYHDTENETFKYAHWTGDAWASLTVSDSGYGTAYSLALDASDYPHIVYTDQGVQYADLQDSKWITQTVGKGNAYSLVMDESSFPHIAYIEPGAGASSAIRYVYWTGSTWFDQVVDTVNTWGGGAISMDLDASGSSHLVYWGGRGGQLEYARRTNGRWNIQTIDHVGGVFAPVFTALAVDTGGIPHIVYLDGRTNELKYARLVPKGQ